MDVQVDIKYIKDLQHRLFRGLVLEQLCRAMVNTLKAYDDMTYVYYAERLAGVDNAARLLYIDPKVNAGDNAAKPKGSNELSETEGSMGEEE